jgi:hypothetical protein
MIIGFANESNLTVIEGQLLASGINRKEGLTFTGPHFGRRRRDQLHKIRSLRALHDPHQV